MNNTPENIGLVRGMLGLRLWNKHDDNDQSNAIAYTRSDLVAEQAAENERLKHDQTAYQSTIDYLRKRAEEAEALASTGAVKVKPLEWVELNEGKAFRAPLPVIGSIRIEPYGVCGWWEVLWSMPGQCDKLIPDVFDTPDEAKAAAQADYQRRILSALDPHPRATKPVDAHETANLSDKPEGQQEPVAWQRRNMYPDAPGAVPQWTQCSASEATDQFKRKPGCEYRSLYTRPSEQAVTNEMVETEMVRMTVSETIRAMGGNPDEQIIGELTVFDAVAVKVRNALKAAMEAG